MSKVSLRAFLTCLAALCQPVNLRLFVYPDSVFQVPKLTIPPLAFLCVMRWWQWLEMRLEQHDLLSPDNAHPHRFLLSMCPVE